MRLSEAIIIYLAAGAPFGVYNLLRQSAADSRVQTSLNAVRAALLWPLTAIKILSSLKHPSKLLPESEAARVSDSFLEKTAQAERQMLASLETVMRLAQELNVKEGAPDECAFRTVREILERYVGLTLVAAESDFDARPGARELELCRIAGRRGDDLLLAGRCIHRRNILRIITHQARARTELLHALDGISELAGITASFNNHKAARHLSVAIVRFHSNVFNLLSLLEDETAARGVSRLLDAECRKLRRMEARAFKEGHATEEETCKPNAPHPIFTGQPQLEAPNQG
jgi:hypothetical protein